MRWVELSWESRKSISLYYIHCCPGSWWRTFCSSVRVFRVVQRQHCSNEDAYARSRAV